MSFDKLPPHDIDAEESVNGSLLIDGRAIYEVAVILQPEDFYTEANRFIYNACLALYRRPNKAEAINQITVAQELERTGRLSQCGGAAYLSHLISAVPTSLDIEHYARIVYRLSVMRQLISASDRIAGIGFEAEPDPNAALDRAEDVLFKLRREGSTDFVHIKNILDRYFEEPATPETIGFQAIPRLYSGLTGLDEFLGGFQRSDLIILAGRTSMGKTSLALNIARNAAVEQGACVPVFSLEMFRETLVQRLISGETNIDSRRIRLGQNSDEEERRIMEAIGKLSEAQIFIDDSPQLKVSELRSKARRLHYQHNLDMVVVDYLQLVQGEARAENRVQEVSYISRSLKALARELKVPVIAVSQLSRAPMFRKDHAPQLEDLRESGSIEQDADLVIFIYREEAYYKTPEEWLQEHKQQNPDLELEDFPRGVADIVIAKNRNGPIGGVKVRFHHNLTRFENIEKQRVEPNLL